MLFIVLSEDVACYENKDGISKKFAKMLTVISQKIVLLQICCK